MTAFFDAALPVKNRKSEKEAYNIPHTDPLSLLGGEEKGLVHRNPLSSWVNLLVGISD